jgi:hypothetical protein
MHLLLTVTLIFSVALINIVELKDCGTAPVINSCRFLGQQTCEWTIINGWGAYFNRMPQLQLPDQVTFGRILSKRTCQTPETPQFCFEFYYSLNGFAHLNVHVVPDEGLTASSHLWSLSTGDGYAKIPINSRLHDNVNTSYVIFVEAKRLVSTGTVFVTNFTFTSTPWDPCALTPAAARPTEVITFATGGASSSTTTVSVTPDTKRSQTDPTAKQGNETTMAGKLVILSSPLACTVMYMYLPLAGVWIRFSRQSPDWQVVQKVRKQLAQNVKSLLRLEHVDSERTVNIRKV